MKIAVLTSGGVDSSVSLKLLKDKGYDVTAFYLKIWLEDELAYLGNCPFEEDLDYVRKICKKEKIPLEVMSLQKEYWDEVVKYTISELKKGRTPNPDVLCNQRIKFGCFYKNIDSSYDFVSTGHYAQTKVIKGKTYLIKSPDPIKDQTYFLANLSQKQIKKAMFPIGQYKKSEVRNLAKKFNLPNKNRKDSQGICFLGKIKFKEFVEHHLSIKKGDMIEFETGQKIAEHKGFFFYTIGQRQGLGLSGGPWYVIKKDIKKNIVYISKNYFSEDKSRNHFKVSNVNWISGIKSKKTDLFVKVRHGPVCYPCKIKYFKDYMDVRIEGRDQGIAKGQFAVFYDDDVCLGGGRIGG